MKPTATKKIPPKTKIILLSALAITVLIGGVRIGTMFRIDESFLVEFSRADYLIQLMNTYLVAVVFLLVNTMEGTFVSLRWRIDFNNIWIKLVLNLIAFIVMYLEMEWLSQNFYGMNFYIGSINYRIFAGNLFLLFSTMLIAWVYRLMVSNYQVSLANERLQKKSAENQLDALKSQINPHFLFNSFYTIKGLIDSNPELARGFIDKLSAVYRYVLDGGEKNIVQVKEELYFMEVYISMLKDRFNDAIEVIKKISPEICEKYMPPLAMQVLLENAVKHNFFDKENRLIINIVSYNGSEIIISNNLQKRPVFEKKSQVGLYNLNLRYKYLSNREIIIQQTEKEFKVKLPLLDQ